MVPLSIKPSRCRVQSARLLVLVLVLLSLLLRLVCITIIRCLVLLLDLIPDSLFFQ